MNAPQPEGPVLRDIHVPLEPPIWPPAPGWWALAIVVLALLAWGFWHLRAWRSRQRRAELWMQAHDQAARMTSTSSRVLATVIVLRRVVAEYQPQSAALAGDAWFDFLLSLQTNSPLDDTLRTLWREGQWQAEIDAAMAERSIEATRVLVRQVTKGRAPR